MKTDKTMTQAKPGKYLTFNLDRESFGFEILTVQEIIGVPAITKVPQAPEYVKGVINLRGKVITIVDLRLKLGLESRPYDERNCIIVVNVSRKSGKVAVGVVVDSVREVLDLQGPQIEPPPQFGVDTSASAIMGVGKVGENVVMLLSIEKELADAELGAESGCTDEIERQAAAQ